MNRARRWIHAALFTSLITAKVFAVEVNVNIKGCITDQKSKEPLIGATVQIVGSSIGAVTDMDGNFQLSGVEDGIYDIEIKYVGYKTAIKRQVKIENNKITTLDFEMVTDEHLLSDVVVVAKANRESESVTLLEQKRSVVAVQAVGAKELARKGVSDAQAAVTKISGISKQEGVKNVFVRGLGDRYNLTTLNRYPIPSEDPEYKNIALDFFSTDVIQSVEVNKAFLWQHLCRCIRSQHQHHVEGTDGRRHTGFQPVGRCQYPGAVGRPAASQRKQPVRICQYYPAGRGFEELPL